MCDEDAGSPLPVPPAIGAASAEHPSYACVRSVTDSSLNVLDTMLHGHSVPAWAWDFPHAFSKLNPMRALAGATDPDNSGEDFVKPRHSVRGCGVTAPDTGKRFICISNSFADLADPAETENLEKGCVFN